jgi:hypothetical protein
VFGGYTSKSQRSAVLEIEKDENAFLFNFSED